MTDVSLTPLQPVAVRHGVVKPGSVDTLDGLMAVNDLEHLTDQRAVLLCSILHTHTHTTSHRISHHINNSCVTLSRHSCAIVTGS